MKKIFIVDNRGERDFPSRRHFLFLDPLKKLAVLIGLPLAFFTTRTVGATHNKYVQGNYAVPQTPELTVAVPYTAAQTAGDLNVVIVGWADSTRHVTSLTDAKGNLYQLAVGPIVTGTLSQAIYYAKNIAAAANAANAVTVTFNAAANFPDIRILEYRGIDPVNPFDTGVQLSGNSATSSSGAVTTANAMDLLVAANTAQTTTVAAGSGFRQRLLTDPDSDIAEDEQVTTTGSYGASAQLGSAGAWVMQMVAFRAAGSPTPTPAPTPIPAKPAYVQGNYAVPQSPDPSVTVPYTAAQTAGNLNVVIVGWADSTTKLSSLTDSKGNGYQLAAGPTFTGYRSQAIFYAANISAASGAANSVTVTFNAAANLPDIRILEYSGLATANSVDTVVGSSGRSATSSSGTLTTTNAIDLLVAANTVQTTTLGPGAGFNQRLLTPDHEIAEDALVTATGSYNASVQLGSVGGWVMQMVAFRAASSVSAPAPTPTPIPTPTPAPTPTPTPSPTPISSVTLTWNADLPTSDPGTNTTGYRLHAGIVSGVYTQTTDVGNTTTAKASNLISGTMYYNVVTAYNSAGIDSPPSNQVSYTAP
jgi:hypothetical protein